MVERDQVVEAAGDGLLDSLFDEALDEDEEEDESLLVGVEDDADPLELLSLDDDSDFALSAVGSVDSDSAFFALVPFL